MPDDNNKLTRNIFVCTCGYMTDDRIVMLDHTIHHLNKRIKELKMQLHHAEKVKNDIEELKRWLEKLEKGESQMAGGNS